MKATYFDGLNNPHILENLEIKLDFDEYYCYDDSDFDDELVKIDIMKHRRYDFKHDFDLKHEYLNETLDEDDYYFEERREEQQKRTKIQKEYYVFWLDFFEHSAISFSLVKERQNIGYYEFDRTRNVGYIAVKKTDWIDYKRAVEIAKERLEEYNNYINWRIYCYNIIDDWINIDSCTWYYRDEDAKNDCIASIEYYLKNKNIEFTKVELD